MARSLTDPDVGFLKDMKTVIMDRDPLFTTQVRACFDSIGCKPKVLPPHSPDLNAYIERFIGTVKRELASDPIADERGFISALHDIRTWYNHDRPHDHLKGRTPAEVWAGIDVFTPRVRTGIDQPIEGIRQESG